MPSIITTTEAAPRGSLNLKASTGNVSMSSSALATPSTASPSGSLSSSNSTLASLRGLYPRAARAFLQRDIALTHSLLTAAFALIEPPPPLPPLPPHAADALASQRRKWAILRITFEATLYAAPPAEDPDALPAPLRANLLLSPEPFIATLHNRALQLFSPAPPAAKPSAAHLPAQVLVTLALAGLKLGCTAVARGMIEDWLARRPQHAEATEEDREGYAKAMELYCLHVLPRLEDWDYAQDFIQYERELAPETRKHIILVLRNLRTQAMSSQPSSSTKGISPSTSEPTLLPSRSASPAHSDSSASSSSSGSTHTATPTTPRPNGKGALHPVSHMSTMPASGSSQSISSATTSRTVTPSNAHTTAPRHRSRSAHRTKADRAGASVSADTPRATTPVLHPLPRPPRAAPLEAPVPRAPSTLALIRTSCAALARGMSRTKMAVYVLVLVVVPLLSFVLRVRRTRGRQRGAGGTVEEVRRRLRSAAGGEAKGVVARVWEELVRAVGDTVQMGGRGLV